ncbi:hypothetical protein Tco_1375829 [Tanacetum coccineum]
MLVGGIYYVSDRIVSSVKRCFAQTCDAGKISFLDGKNGYEALFYKLLKMIEKQAGVKKKSGKNDEDILKSANNDYKAKRGHSFAYMHVWDVLKSCEKWKLTEIPDFSGGCSKKSKTFETNSCSIPFNLNLEFDDDFDDSQSTQASERKRKVKGKGTSTSPFNMKVALSRMEEGFAVLMNHVVEFQKRDDVRDKKKEILRRSVSIRCQGYIGDFVLGCHAKDMVALCVGKLMCCEPNQSCLSDDSGGTYTEVSSPFEGLSDIGSPRADEHEYLELPWMPEDPHVEVALQAPPSLDYVPGPEEPEQAPPSPDYVPAKKHADD